ncbi:MAG: hypothetical protein J0I12_33295 [Candidatus Eremiobacteraeota bacterium]|nr:hypothetical protein [Candidatus Eremiobacteraeota bacterium]
MKASSIFEYQQGKGSPRLQGASIRSCYAQAQSPTERCSDVFERSEGGIHKISYQEGKIGQNNSAVFVDAKIEPGLWSNRFFAVVRDTRGQTWIADAQVPLVGWVSGKTMDAGFGFLDKTAGGCELYAPALRQVSGAKDWNSFEPQDTAHSVRMAQEAKELVNSGKNPWGTFPQAIFVN